MGKKHKKKKTASGGKRPSSGQEEPMRQKCFTTDFATMIQLFRCLTEYLEFSKPFKLIVHYDPALPRVTIETYAPIEVHGQCIRKAKEIEKDQCILPSSIDSSL